VFHLCLRRCPTAWSWPCGRGVIKRTRPLQMCTVDTGGHREIRPSIANIIFNIIALQTAARGFTARPRCCVVAAVSLVQG
jgi:hypothetical protein